MPWIEHNRILSWHRKKFDEIFVFSYCIRILFRYHACRNEDGSDWWNAINWQVSKQGLPWPSASVRSSSAKANIRYWLAFFFVPWAGNKYAIFRPVPIRYALLFQRKEKDYVGLRIHWSNPCRFNSCRPHHIKTKASGFLERMSGGFFLWLRLAKKQARDITSN